MSAQATVLFYKFENYTFKTTATSSRSQWVNVPECVPGGVKNGFGVPQGSAEVIADIVISNARHELGELG